MSPEHPDYYPVYSRAERVADGTMHVLGISLGVIASIYLVWLAATTSTAVSSVIIYCCAVTASFIASALYHFTPSEGLRPAFRRADHAAIFVKIAGTYTPLVALIGGGFSYSVLGLVWVAAMGGVIWKLVFWSEPDWRSTLLYVALGWASLALAWPFATTMPALSSALVVAGGLTYTAGVVFYRWDNLRFSVAIWHGFVIAASSCFFAAIATAMMHHS